MAERSEALDLSSSLVRGVGFKPMNNEIADKLLSFYGDPVQFRDALVRFTHVTEHLIVSM